MRTRLIAGLVVLSGVWIGALAHASSTPGVTASTITLGNTNLLSGPYSYWGQGIKIGLLTYFKAVNDAGGIHGRTLRVIFHDDEFHPAYARANVHRLLTETRVFALVGVGGTATNDAILPDIVRTGVPTVGVLSHAHHFIAPVKSTHFTLQPSYYQQAMSMVDYLVARRKRTRIAVLYEANAFGAEVLQGVQARLQQYGLRPVAAEDFRRGVFDVLPAIVPLYQARAQAVILGTLARDLPRIFAEAQGLDFAPVWAGLSNLARRQTSELADASFTSQLVVLTPFMDPQSQTPGIREFRRLLERYYPGHLPQEPEFHGYATARVVVEALRRVGRTVTRQRFIQALETLQHFEPGTTPPLTFSRTRHYGSTAVRFIRPYFLRWEPVADWQELPESVAPVATPVARSQPRRRR